MPGPITTETRGPAVVLTLARPPVNVLDLATLGALDEALRSAADAPATRAIVLRSSLAGTFSAGMDVAEHAPDHAPAMLDAAHALFRTIDALRVPVAMAVDGRCLGGAFEIALVCDAVYATAASRFAFPEIDVGCFPPLAAAILPGRVPAAAAELVLTGRTLTAEEAAQLGLVTRVVADPLADALAFADAVAHRSAAVVAITRRALREGDGRLDALRRTEALYRDALLKTEDAAEGVGAFLEKRKPRWTVR
jgi:cyclohexa-1,5-dienecarbonyl-CoA hydratase